MGISLFEEKFAEVDSEIGQGHLLLALSLAKKLVTDFPNNASAHYIYGEALKLSGDAKTALAQTEVACGLEPGNFQYLYMCGKLYNQFKLHEYAISYLTKSVNIEPRACLSQYELGFSFFEMRLSDKALPHFRAALKLQPEHDLKDIIRFQIAQCLEFTNQTSEALPLFKRLAKECRAYEARCLMSIVELEGAELGSPIESKLRELLAKSDRSNAEKRTAWLALGKIYSKVGNVKEAFAAWGKAAEFGQQPDQLPREHEKQYREITSFYTPELFDLCKAFGSDSQAPVFVAGMPRSGTTLTEQIVSSHSQASGVGEVARWRTLEESLRREYESSSHMELILTNAKEGELRRRAEEILDLFRLIAGKTTARVIEKMPHNFVFAGFQALLFPKAKFLHLRRHPADAFISTYQNNFSAFHSYGLNQEDYIKEWAFHEKMMTYWKSIFGDRILTVQYEHLATDPETEARRIIEFIGLPWEDGCLEFYKRKTTVRTFSTQQVRKPVYTSSVEKWRVYEPFLGPLFKTMEELKLSYPPKN